MNRKCKAILTFPIALAIFTAVPLAILTPLLLHLNPALIVYIDSPGVLSNFFGSSSTAPTTASQEVSSSTTTTTTTAPATPPATASPASASAAAPFSIGQVFTHSRVRYQGVIIAVLTNKEKKKLKLPTNDDWYSALVDVRYKPGGLIDNVSGKDITLAYPSEGNIKHPKLREHFSGFDSDTFSFIRQSRKHVSKKKTKTNQEWLKKKKKQEQAAKKKKKNQRI